MEKNTELTKLERLKREEKLKNVLLKVLEKGNGNGVRHLVRIVANAYENNPEKLRRYFNSEDNKIAGIATSAYHFLTGDIKPIQTREYGGLGAIINDSEHNLEFGRCQLHFAQLSGKALWHSKNVGYVLENSTNSGYALKNSNNSSDALWRSKNSGSVLGSSTNSGDALRGSENSSIALWHSTNSGNALRVSKNSGYALWHSKNSGDTLQGSENSESVKRNIGKIPA